MPNETWTAPDNNCTKFTCKVFGDEFLTASQQETCPELEDCPKENIYMKGCCQFCNKTAESQSNFYFIFSHIFIENMNIFFRIMYA